MNRRKEVAVRILIPLLLTIVLIGIIFICTGADPYAGERHIRAFSENIALTWDNGESHVYHDQVDLDDPHLVSVKAWGNGVCWITFNDRVVSTQEKAGPILCAWDRSSS
jgi:hypothetical protein